MLVPENIQKIVVFIGIKEKGRFLPRATGFLVSIDEDGHRFYHIVTAEHVVSGLLTRGHEIWLRTNIKDGKAREARIPDEYWRFHPDNAVRPTDVAAAIINLEDDEDAVVVPIIGPAAAVAAPDVISNLSIDAAEEVAIVGLFRSHYG